MSNLLGKHKILLKVYNVVKYFWLFSFSLECSFDIYILILENKIIIPTSGDSVLRKQAATKDGQNLQNVKTYFTSH